MAAFNKRSLYKPAVTIERPSTDPVSPRRKQPTPSPVTPTPPPPSQSLSLSDADSSPYHNNEETPAAVKETPLTPDVTTVRKPVLVTRTLDAQPVNSAEIPVSTIKVPSPVKVIRHPLPLPAVTGDDRRFSTDFVRPKNLEPVPMTRQNMEETNRGAAGMSLNRHLVERGTDSSSDSNEDINDLLHGPPLPHEEESIVEPLLLPDNDKSESVAMETKDSKTKKTKKRNERAIPSRYMSAAGNYKKPKNPPPSRAAAAAKSVTVVQKSSKSNSSTILKATDISFDPAQCPTSTPAVTKPLVAAATRKGTTSGTTTLRPTTANNGSRKPQGAKETVSNKRAAAGAFIDPLSREGLLNARLLQITYLNIRARKAIKLQDEQAQAQIYALWEACKERKREVTELKKELEYKNRMRALDTVLNSQSEGLDSLCERFPEVMSSHSEMSQSLDSTRHELPIRNIEAVKEDDLLEAMTEAEISAGGVASLVNEVTPQVTALATGMESLVETVKKEESQLQRVWLELNSLTGCQVHETSLYYEKQRREDDQCQ